MIASIFIIYIYKLLKLKLKLGFENQIIRNILNIIFCLAKYFLILLLSGFSPLQILDCMISNVPYF
jgi:hypothetical protein